MKPCAVIALAFAFYSKALFALELTEIARLGPTTPVDQYFVNISYKDYNNAKLDKAKARQLLKAAKANITKNIFFPLKAQNLKPGVFKGYRFATPKAIQPFAVAGMDALSLQWLTLRQDKLLQIKAPIYIIEADTFEAINRLTRRFKGLKFIPSAGDTFSDEIKAPSYPFLVTTTGIWQ